MNFTKYIPHTFELTDAEIAQVARHKLEAMLLPGEFLREQEGTTWLKRDEEYYHGSPSEEKVRIATEIDKAVWLILNKLRNDEVIQGNKRTR